MIKRLFPNIVFLVITLLVGFILRIYGLNWDQGQHLHPDERFLTMVETVIKLPNSIRQYFDTSTSPLNPYNYQEFQFFVYGTFPLFLTKIIGQLFDKTGYDQIHLVGRVLSAIFDSLNILLLYCLSLKIFPKKSKSIFIAGTLYAFCILPIQLSHFFAVDTFLAFFILLTFTLLVYKKNLIAPIAFGLALACKISAIYFIPIYAIFILINFIKNKNLISLFFIGLTSLAFSFITFRIFQPYAFSGLVTINHQFIDNLNTLSSYNVPDTQFPPGVQWISKKALIFPLQNIVFWGIGIPLCLLFLVSLPKQKIRNFPPIIWLSIIWVIFLFLYQGFQFVTTMRYFIPIYPFIVLIVSYFSQKVSKIKYSFIIFHLLLGIIFVSIYSRPHSRIQASKWIYQNISPSSKYTVEYWDDGLPLGIPNYSSAEYHSTTVSPYDPDSSEKWTKLNNVFSDSDYIFLTSNRLWSSIPQVPLRYPLTTKYYQDLFDEKRGFTKIAEINSYPGISLSFLKNCYYFGPTNFPYKEKKNTWFTVDPQCFYPGIYFRDDTAEEIFTVIDHPKVIIFKNDHKF